MADAKILLFDIESAPNSGFVWGKWEQNVVEFQQEWYLLSVAWKWLGESKVHVIGLDDFPKQFKADPTNDIEIARTIHELFEEADVVVGHNSNSFDNKKAQGRMLVHGLAPPSPYQEVDTLRQAKRHFSFNSYRLGDLASALGVGSKGETGGFATWLGCMGFMKSPSGHIVPATPEWQAKCWKQMKKYNKQDVVILEEVYQKMLPWMNGHPNVAFLRGDMDGCVNCGETKYITFQGTRKTRTLTYQRVKCAKEKGGCGAWSRKRIAEKGLPKPTYTN